MVSVQRNLIQPRPSPLGSRREPTHTPTPADELDQQLSKPQQRAHPSSPGDDLPALATSHSQLGWGGIKSSSMASYGGQQAPTRGSSYRQGSGQSLLRKNFSQGSISLSQVPSRPTEREPSFDRAPPAEQPSAPHWKERFFTQVPAHGSKSEPDDIKVLYEGYTGPNSRPKV